ncbi:hypothetical protein [Tepidimonas sp.]|uniref:hypothetical protein n=1 Tax=Tepidimonas sp. TaxID=2002775 RepID=UPI003918E774
MSFLESSISPNQALISKGLRLTHCSRIVLYCGPNQALISKGLRPCPQHRA